MLFFIATQYWRRRGSARFGPSNKVRLVVICGLCLIAMFRVGGARAIEFLPNLAVHDSLYGERSSAMEFATDNLLGGIYSHGNLERMENGIKRLGWKAGSAAALTSEKTVGSSYFSSGEMSERMYLLSSVPNGSPFEVLHPVSSEFGTRVHPVHKKIRLHKGVDFAAASGTTVHATANGVVDIAADTGISGYGKYVVIRHGLGFSSLYAHLRDINVKPGTYLSKGEILGRAGNSGSSTGPHLHYEVKYLDKALDPKNFLAWSGENYFSIFSNERTVPWHDLRKLDAPISQVARLPFYPDKNY
mgnify:FL=1